MALNRADITVIDDDGTESTGTVFDAAFFEALYDAIDEYAALLGPSEDIPFFNMAGPTSERTFTFPDANATVFTSAGIGNTALKILDTDASHYLSIVPGSNLTADRVFTLVTGDAARTVTLSGNPTLADWFDQSVKAAASPTFAAVKTAAGGLQTLDTNASHYLKITAGSDITADRTYTIVTGDADRTLTLSGNPTLADWFDQAVKAASSPTFAAPTVTSITIGSASIDGTDAAKIDGITNGTAAASKALVLDANKDIATIRHLTLSGNLVIGATTLSETELGYVDGLTAGTVTASKALVVDANKDLASLRNLTVTGWVKAGAGTVGAPSITILDSSSNVDNGFYSPGVDHVGVVINGAKAAQFAYGTIGGNSSLLSNTISGGTMTVIGANANEFMGFGHFDFGGACAFRNSSNEIEFWGYNGTAYQPVLTLLAPASGKSQIEIRKPDDTRGMTLNYPSSGNPTITISVPAGSNNAGVDLFVAGGTSTGSGTPGAISFRTASAGSSGSTENSLVERMKLREGTSGLILTNGIPLRLGDSDVAGAGVIRMQNAAQINARNAANNNNLTLVDTTSGDLVRVGGDGSNLSGIQLQPGSGDIRWGKALVSLGGGSAATLGTIGGSGPATAGQNTWMRLLDSSGVAFWVPAWK